MLVSSTGIFDITTTYFCFMYIYWTMHNVKFLHSLSLFSIIKMKVILT